MNLPVFITRMVETSGGTSRSLTAYMNLIIVYPTRRWQLQQVKDISVTACMTLDLFTLIFERLKGRYVNKKKGR